DGIHCYSDRFNDDEVDGPTAPRAVLVWLHLIVLRAGVVVRPTIRRLPPRRRRYLAGVRAGRPDARGATAHLGRPERRSNLGTRQSSYGVCVGSFGVSAALDHRFGNRPHSPTAPEERCAPAGLVSALTGDRFVDPLKSERTRNR